MSSTAAQPHVAFFQLVAEPRPLSFRFRHLNPSNPRPGCLIKPTKVEALKAVVKRDVLVPDIRPKDEQIQSGMPEMIDAIREALRSMGDGEISISPYDTAWVALVKSLNGDDTPQFPSCIDWIARNQLPDGSWGDDFFLVQDRIINTLACIIALKSWNVHDDACKKGLSFVSENMWRLTKDDDNWTLCGFEIIFPMLLEKAKNLGLNIPLDDPTLEAIYTKRQLKLTKIPSDALHVVPTTFLLSIEGMPGLDWKRLCKLQCPNGSFMCSLAPTAYALMETGDPKCFEFIDRVVNKFNGSVPFIYPIEMFERLWAVDRLERLGISRYFKSEIKDYLDYVYRNWNEEGLAFTKDCLVKDIDDTAMGFRLLRLHGYNVSPCVFKNFENDDGQFVCYARESNHSVTAMYSLFRAADQTSFTDDDHILQRAKSYSLGFLRDRRAMGQLNDKWAISEGLTSELCYGLDFPWKASLPRIETRMYLEQYSGSAEVGIGKVLYREDHFNNDMYLKVAKADFTNFQRMCQQEWHSLERWYDKNNLEMYGVTQQSVLRAYFLAAANIFESSRAAERLAWARTAVLAEAISNCLLISSNTHDDRTTTVEWFTTEFVNSKGDNLTSGGGKKNSQVTSSLKNALREFIDIHASGNASVADCLHGAWREWFMAWTKMEKEGRPCTGDTALLIVRTVEICSGRHHSNEQDIKLLPDYSKLEQLTRSICCKLAAEDPALTGEHMERIDELDRKVGLEMQELAQCVFQSCGSIDSVTRQTFLHVTKSSNYVALCSPETIEHHISKESIRTGADFDMRNHKLYSAMPVASWSERSETNNYQGDEEEEMNVFHDNLATTLFTI